MIFWGNSEQDFLRRHRCVFLCISITGVSHFSPEINHNTLFAKTFQLHNIILGACNAFSLIFIKVMLTTNIPKDVNAIVEK